MNFRHLLLLFFVLFLGACSAKLQPIPYKAPADINYRGEFQPGMRDKMPLYGRYWAPTADAPKAILVLVHGTAEHGGLFAPLAETMAREGYGVYAVDMQGWGRSKGVKKRMGYVLSHDDYVRDVASTYTSLRRQFPTTPIYGVGESLGATVLLRGQLTGTLKFDGLIMSGPGYRPNPSLLGIRGPDFVARIGLWSAGIFGDIMPGWPTIPTNMGIRMAICTPNVQERMLKDPYVPHKWLPAVYLSTLHDSQVVINEHLNSLSTPFLIIHGEKDSLIPESSSGEIIRRAQTKDKQLVIIKKGCHANLIEATSWPQAAKAMSEWLAKRVKTPEASVPSPAAATEEGEDNSELLNGL